MLVLDSSYALALFMPDEARPSSVAAVLAERLIAPSLWPMELANGAASAIRQRRIDEQEAHAVCLAADQLQVELYAPGRGGAHDWLGFAQAHSLTSHDAAYLDLALAHRCALATCDTVLASAARRAGVRVFG
jgi:predicted nucleic acid-binding protein